MSCLIGGLENTDHFIQKNPELFSSQWLGHCWPISCSMPTLSTFFLLLFISVACVLCCRLALERADSPSRAVDMLGRLLQGHGQGGSCTEHISSWTYQNSFLIAGQSEAWVFETAGRHWDAEQIKSRICSKYFSFISFYLCLQLI